MADLAQSAVAKTDIFYTEGVNGRRFKAAQVTLTLTGQGGLANKIPASLFGLRTISRVFSARLSTSVLLNAGPSYDGLYLIFGGSTGTPTDQNGTVKAVVEGFE